MTYITQTTHRIPATQEQIGHDDSLGHVGLQSTTEKIEPPQLEKSGQNQISNINDQRNEEIASLVGDLENALQNEMEGEPELDLPDED